VAALVLGIAGLIIFPIVCSLLGIIFGAIARNEIAHDPLLEGMGMATAGLVTGIVGLVLWPLVLIALA
jgi:uncharacterized protein DUF4190